MALVSHTITALAESDDQGTDGKNIIANAVVSMFNLAGVAAVLYDDAQENGGSTAKTTGANGQVIVYVESGEYNESINGSLSRRVTVTELIGQDPAGQRNKLGLGTASTKNVGVDDGDVLEVGAFGIGTDNLSDVTSGSCNDLVKVGFYVVASTVSDRPTADGVPYGINVFASNGSASALYQSSYPLYVAEPKEYIRSQNNGVWSSWVEILTPSGLGTAALQDTTEISTDNTLERILRVGDLEYARPDYTKESLELIAHRGFRDLFPQNTIPAFTSAIRRGADSLECDVSFSAQGTAYIFHDTSVDDLTNGSGVFTTLNDAYIDSLTLNQLVGTIIADTKIPLFEWLLDYASKGGIKIYPEIKAINSTADIDTFISLIESYGMEENCVAQSFTLSNIEYLRGKNQTIEIGLLGSSTDPSVYEPLVDSLAALKRSYLLWFEGSLVAQPEIIDYAKSKGVKVATYTVDSNDRAKELMQLGVNQIMSDITLEVL